MRAEALAQYGPSAPAAGRAATPPAGLYVTPSLTLREGYDDNITDEVQGDPAKEGDFIFRTQPQIVAGYQSAPFSLLASYLIAADVYAEHPSFNTFPARQEASLRADYLPDPKLGLSANGGYQQSQYSGQLNSAAASEQTGLPATGVSNGRARTTIYYAGASAKYTLTPLNSVLADYLFDHTHQVGTPSSEAHNVDTRFSHRFTETDEGDVGFIYRHFTGQESPTSAVTPQPPPSSVLVIPSVTNSYAGTLGWTHQFSALTEVVLRAGPRFDDSASNVHAEALASITRKLARGAASFTYLNTQSTVVGVGGSVNVSSYLGNLSYDLTEALNSGLYLGLYQSTNPGQGQGKITDVYTAGMSLRYRLMEWLSIVLNYDFSYQDGAVSPVQSTSSDIIVVTSNNTIQRNLVSIGLEASEPFRLY
jgi:hypothetical protein